MDLSLSLFRFIKLNSKFKKNKPFNPTDGPPAATAANAYSICTSFPDGLKNKKVLSISA